MLWLCSVFCLSVRAETISAQFAVTYQNKLTAAESTGVQPAANWNVVEANSGYSGNVVSLKNSSGTTTTMSLAWTTDRNGIWPRSGTAGTATGKLYSAVLTAGGSGPTGGNATVTLSGVPYTTYTIYAYLASGQANRAGKIKLNSGSLTNWNAQQFDASTTFTEVTGSNATGNYIKWTGVTGSSATITVQPNGGWVPVGITGIQVVEEVAIVDVVSAQFAVTYQNKLTAGETAGVQPAANWNVVEANSGYSGTKASLKNAAGTTTGISLAWTTDNNGIWPRGGNATTPDGKVLAALLVGGASGSSSLNATVTLSGIPYPAYTIYAYFASPQSNRTGKIRLNNGIPFSFSAQNFNAYPFTEVTDSNTSGNYVKWTGLTGSTQTITLQPSGAWSPTGIGGIQIVATGSPAPVMTATATSHQSGNEPAKALDGNTNTFWHSQWSPNLPLPQSITIDQGSVKTVASLRYLPRQDGGSGAAHGNITSYNIYVSTNGSTFTKVVDLGTWSSDSSRKTANFTPVSARYVRLEAITGHGGWANASEITLSDTPWYKPNQTIVLSPAYGSNITGNTTVNIVSPGMTTATVRCWQAGGNHGSDSVVATVPLSGVNGTGSFVFPANSYPHGPITVRIAATNANGNTTDNCYLQLYNTGGTVWNQGIPASAPPAAAGMNLVFSDDFTSMPTISSNGIGATYAAFKPNGGGNFSGIPFANASGTANPFSQVGSYLRIRADAAKNSTGFISSLRTDGTGFWTRAPAYFECRFIAQSAPGTWPAFWLMSFDTVLSLQAPSDELDIIEAYGGEGGGTPNAPRSYRVTSHNWNQVPAPASEYRISKSVDMSTVGGTAGWMWTPHVYGCLVGEVDTVYYLDNVEIGRHKTSPLSKVDKLWFMANFAVGGISGWAIDLSRYNGVADMYIDYVRVYAAP